MHPGPQRQPSVPDKVDIAPAKAKMIQGSSGPGSGDQVGDKNRSSKRGVAVPVSQVRTLRVDPSIQKSHQCDL